jgi:hypothetical protein
LLREVATCGNWLTPAVGNLVFTTGHSLLARAEHQAAEAAHCASSGTVTSRRTRQWPTDWVGGVTFRRVREY